MKIFQFVFLILLLGILAGCEPDLCENVDCGPGDCLEGICECPEGFIGDNCEIKLCFGVPCYNGDCNLETKTCNCNPNYFGEECNIYCANGEFIDGKCNCFEGYEGSTCETESRDRFLGWWACEEWTWTDGIGGEKNTGFLPASMKFECGNSVPDVKLFPTANSNGLLLLNSNNKIEGQVTKFTINFELQNLTNEVAVYGSASLGNDRILSVTLRHFNSTTSVTEVARGTFTLYRNINTNDCD